MKTMVAKFLTVCFILLTGTAAMASTITIDDNYWGAAPTSGWPDQDVIGDPNHFDIDKMELWVDGGYLYVDIFTNYVNHIGALGTELGDLFISTDGWTPNGTESENYRFDNKKNGENWEYVLVMDSRPDSNATSNDTNNKGTASLYSVGQGIIMSSAANDNYVFREGQEVQYAPSPSETASSTDGWWQINSSNGSPYLRYHINMTALDFSDTDAGRTKDLGFHWTMTCANDVIEGGATLTYHTPEPATMILFGFGLIFLARIGRRGSAKELNGVN